MLHSASLVIDDIEDGSIIRRGSDAAHVRYGVPRALNAANYAYFLALQEVLHLSPSTPEKTKEMVQIFNEEMQHLHHGQGLDILWRETKTMVSREAYRQMVVDKTGGLFRLAVRLMWSCMQATKDGEERDVTLSSLLAFVDDLAYYFQIRDDYLNLTSATMHETKGYCDDIIERKFSYLVLYALNHLSSSEKRTELLDILGKRTTDPVEINRAIEWIRECGAFSETFDVLHRLYEDLHVSLHQLGGHARFSPLLIKMKVNA
jgi:geranylgeranyl diphosphate synthase type 3